MQIAWQALHFATCDSDENWWNPRTKNRFWGCRFWDSLGQLRNTSVL
jgi:hypothetical protein